MNRRRVLQFASITVAIGLIVGGYFAFRYTALADLQETINPVDRADTIAYGRQLFQTRGCAGCHSMDDLGAVGDEGPDLSHIAARADAAAIRQSISEPNAVIAANCPEGACQAGIMPQFGQILDAEQIDALVAYLSQQQ